MGDKTGIQWSDATWNPVTGCTKVSQGCKNCYAEGVAERFWEDQYEPIVCPRCAGSEQPNVCRLCDGRGEIPRRFTDVMCHEDRLDQPLRWKRPRRIFVNSMSDLFHEDVPDGFIAQVFAVMAAASQHTFQVLTKRPERMKRLVSSGPDAITVEWDILAERRYGHDCGRYPLPNVHLGVSVEDQATADERIPLLLDTPAALRFVSYEPALAGVDLDRWVFNRRKSIRHAMYGPMACNEEQADAIVDPVLDWIIVGGESGPKARPFDLAWARQTVKQCRAAGVPVFVKQLGARPVDDVKGGPIGSGNAGIWRNVQLRKRKGDDPSEWPEDLRVQEFPDAVAA